MFNKISDLNTKLVSKHTQLKLCTKSNNNAVIDQKSIVKNNVSAVVTVHDLPNKSFGSGFVINSDGYILTGYYVINEIKNPKIEFNNDTTKYLADVIMVHEDMDIALLKINKIY